MLRRFRPLTFRRRRYPWFGDWARACFDGDKLKRLDTTGESSSLLCARLRRAKSPYTPPLESLLVGVIAFGAIGECHCWNTNNPWTRETKDRNNLCGDQRQLSSYSYGTCTVCQYRGQNIPTSFSNILLENWKHSSSVLYINNRFFSRLTCARGGR